MRSVLATEPARPERLVVEALLAIGRRNAIGNLVVSVNDGSDAGSGSA